MKNTAETIQSDSEFELQRASELADAQLGVAEELGWPLAILALASAHLFWSNWLVSLVVAVGSYYLAILKYRRRSAAAEDKYFQAARLGKYARLDGDA